MTVAGWRVSRRQPCVSCVRSPAALATAPCPFACEPLVDVVAGTRESFAGRREVTRTRSEHSLGNPANLPNAYYATACRYNLFIRCEIRIDCSCRHHTLALRRCRDLIRISCAVARPKTDTRTPSASVHWCDELQKRFEVQRCTGDVIHFIKRFPQLFNFITPQNHRRHWRTHAPNSSTPVHFATEHNRMLII